MGFWFFLGGVEEEGAMMAKAISCLWQDPLSQERNSLPERWAWRRRRVCWVLCNATAVGPAKRASIYKERGSVCRTTVFAFFSVFSSALWGRKRLVYVPSEEMPTQLRQREQWTNGLGTRWTKSTLGTICRQNWDKIWASAIVAKTQLCSRGKKS